MLLDAAQIDPPVAALEEVERLDRFVTESRRDQAHVGPVRVGELEDRRQTLLDRDLDEPAAAAEPRAPDERAHRRDRGVRAALKARLLPERLERRHVVGAGTAAVQVGDAT